MKAEEVSDIFTRLFGQRYRVRIAGGASEPLYVADAKGSALILFRDDYVSSALHEIAHWCIAGRDRRAQDDYGYWYQPDRDEVAQRRFELAESKPQGLERIFSAAADIPFRLSHDNFEVAPTLRFASLVQAQTLTMLDCLRGRRLAFATALAHRSGCYHYDCIDTYREMPR